MADQTSRSAAHSGRSRPGLALHGDPNSRRGSAITKRVRRARPRQALRGPTRAARTPIWTAASARRHAQTNTDAGRRWSTCTGNVRRNGQAGQSDTASPTLPDHPDGDGRTGSATRIPADFWRHQGALDSQLRRLGANRQAEKPMMCAASQRARRRRFSLCLARAPEAR